VVSDPYATNQESDTTITIPQTIPLELTTRSRRGPKISTRRRDSLQNNYTSSVFKPPREAEPAAISVISILASFHGNLLDGTGIKVLNNWSDLLFPKCSIL
jgi:hypothetical protein